MSIIGTRPGMYRRNYSAETNHAIRKEEILSAVVKSGRSYEEIMNFLNAGSDGEKTEK